MFESERVFFIWLRFIITREKCFQSTCLMHPLPSRVLHALMFCNADLKHDMLVCFQYACRDQEDGGRWRKNICLSFSPQGLRGELSGGSGGFYPYLKPAPAWIRRMVHSSPTENRLFFSPLAAQMTTSQQEVHGIGCKDSGEFLGQCWVRLVEFDSLKASLLEL